MQYYKTIRNGFATVAALLGMSFSAKGQSSSSAFASAVIVAPITILSKTNLNFGNVAVAASPGAVLMSPSGIRSSTGGVTLPATVGAPAAAAFIVSGESSYTYAITLPSGPVVITSSTGTMVVDKFTSAPGSTGSLSVGNPGTQLLNVGASLSVGAVQPAGVYISPIPFYVTVNYN